MTSRDPAVIQRLIDAANRRADKARAAGNELQETTNRESAANLQAQLDAANASGTEATADGTRPDPASTVSTTTPSTTTTEATTEPTTTAPAEEPTSTAFTTTTDTANAYLDELKETRTEQFSETAAALEEASNIRQSAFDQLYGEDSSIASFFNPTLNTLNEAIADVETDLDSLNEDVQTRFEDVGVTDAEFNRIESVERAELVDQLESLTRSYDVLMDARNMELELADREYSAIVDDANAAVQAALTELEYVGLSEAEIAIFSAALTEQVTINAEQRSEEQRLKEQAEAEEAADEATVQAILDNALNLVTSAGVIPTDAFQQVIADAFKMLEEGKSISEIQLGVLQAVGNNSTVRSYINSAFSAAGTGSGASGSGKLSSSQLITLVAGGYTDVPLYATDLSEAQAALLESTGSTGSDGDWYDNL